MMHQLEVSQLDEELFEQYNRRSRATFPSSTVRQRERQSTDLSRHVSAASLMPDKAKSSSQIAEKTPQVVVMQLEFFEQVTQAVEILWQSQSLVLNVTQLNAELAQRAVDFVAGATFSLEGQQQYLAPGVFLFAPNGVQLANAVDETSF